MPASKIFDIFSTEYETSKDSRRTIYEAVLPNEAGCLQGFVFHGSEPTGRHYHLNKHELFEILETGPNDESGVVLLYPIVLGERFDPDKIQRRPLTAGSVVHMPPMMAHTFYLPVGSRKICFSTKSFDPSDMTVVPELV